MMHREHILIVFIFVLLFDDVLLTVACESVFVQLEPVGSKWVDITNGS